MKKQTSNSKEANEVSGIITGTRASNNDIDNDDDQKQ
jgi:hypothetical protein